MGYYTSYNLTVYNANEGNINQVKSSLRNLGLLNYVFWQDYAMVGNHYDFCCCESQKWYEYEEDMKAVSKQFPEMIFELDGEGEENSDMWKAYFQNGEMEYCPASIQYPEPQRIKPPN